jgi:hypothetical protein
MQNLAEFKGSIKFYVINPVGRRTDVGSYEKLLGTDITATSVLVYRLCLTHCMPREATVHDGIDKQLTKAVSRNWAMFALYLGVSSLSYLSPSSSDFPGKI